MAPSATLPAESETSTNGHAVNNGSNKRLKKNGILDASFKFDDVTPIIGREYPTTNIVNDILDSPHADDLIRDLAITSENLSSTANSQT